MKHMRTCHKAVPREHGIETRRSAMKRSAHFLMRKTWILALLALFAVSLHSYAENDKPSAVGSKDADKKTTDSQKAGQQSTCDGAISDVEDRWFSLETNQTYIADFTLEAGAAQKLKIKSEKEKIWVCFRADGTPAVNKKHLGGVPLRMQQKDGVWVCGSLLAGTLFHPIDGVIHLTVTNEVDDPFRVVVYTKNE